MNIGIGENRPICKFNLRGMCRFGNRCWNRHEIPEKMAQKFMKKIEPLPKEEEGACALALGACALSPTKHNKVPLREIFGPSTSSSEEAINLVKIAESEEKVCGICFDTISKKVNKYEQTFGILPNCIHCFCFTCIRKWRQSKEFELDVCKACPECRVASDFVYPSKVWLESKQEKDNFIDTQREIMKRQDCKYFRKGKGKCPFGNTCLYLHALPNGKVMDVGPPSNKRNNPFNLSEADLLHQILFWMNDDDDIDLSDLDDELDLDDPCIAIQYYDKDDFRYYLAMDRLVNGCDSDDEYDFEYM